MPPHHFQVIPAVDLLGDEAVRLEQGDYERVMLRESDPAALVARFAAAGAPLVHVVDLDGARSGKLRPELIARLAEAARPAELQASAEALQSELDLRLAELAQREKDAAEKLVAHTAELAEAALDAAQREDEAAAKLSELRVQVASAQVRPLLCCVTVMVWV